MTRRILLALAVLLAPPLAAQGTNTDVFLAPIQRIGDSIVIRSVANITHRDGYDNQPSFTADSRSILYTAQDHGQTDIWRYDIATRRTARVTNTPESEYSAVQVPGETRFSVVRVEHDSTQRLWTFAADGSDPQLLLPRLRGVGYQAWLGPQRLAAYVLGNPSTLHIAERDGSYEAVISRGVGRSVERVPEGAGALFSFTQRGYADKPGVFVFTGRADTTRFAHKVVAMDARGAAVTRTVNDSVVIGMQRPYQLVTLPPDNEFHTWTPDGTLLTASGSVLLRWSGALDAGSTLIPVANLARFGVKNVTRLAVSPDGAWLAFVAEPASP